MVTTWWSVALLATTALHAGFQATVTLLVYPALSEVPAQQWSTAHERHSRRITPLVALVYGAVLVASVGAVVAAPSAGVWTSAACTALVLADTALVAAPLHGRLGHGRDERLVQRLLAADRFRLVGATLALVAAVVGCPA